MNTKRDYKSFDFILVILVCILVVFGIMVIGSATRINLPDVATSEYSSQQLWFATGLVLMFLAAFIDYQFICKFYIPIYCLNIFLLLIVFVLDRNSGGVTRWISFGGVGIQPSEFAKIFMILFLAKFIDKYNDKINNIFILLAIVSLIAMPTVLIYMQPSLSASLVIPAISIAILFVGNIHYKYVLGALGATVPISIFFLYDILREEHLIVDKILKTYHIERILAAIYSDYATSTNPLLAQQSRSIQAIGSGQFYGKGLYEGTFNQLNYLAASHNDFIFAVIGEEFGFVGCIFVIGLQLLIIMKCLLVAQKATTFTGRLICTGVAAMIAFQSFVNVSVSTGLLPNTGMPFPFVSYGGSSLWISMIGIGLVINVGMTKQKSMFEG